MTLAASPGEIWEPEDGAPAGIEFEISIPSKSKPGVVYKIARDARGAIWHVSACELWRFSPRRDCSHVTRAIALAEQPEATFLEDARRAYEAVGGALATGDDIYAWWQQVHRLCGEARNRRFVQMKVYRQRGEWDAKTREDQVAESLEAFG